MQILFNKSVLAHFPFPFLLTFWHMLCASIVTKILQITSKKYIPKSSTVSYPILVILSIGFNLFFAIGYYYGRYL